MNSTSLLAVYGDILETCFCVCFFTMKTKVCILVGILFSLFAIPGFAQEVTVDGIKYELNKKVYIAVGSVNAQEIDAPGEAMVVSGNYSGDIVIPETITYNENVYTVTSIGNNAFFNTGLTSLSIPATVEAFGVKGIMNCKSLKLIICNAAVPPKMAKQAFQAMDSQVKNMALVVPAQSLDLYVDDPVWGMFMYDPTRTDTESHVVVRTNYVLDDGLAAFEEKAKIHYEINSNGDTINWHYESYNSAFNEYNAVSYKRTFRNTNWQALYVPLELRYDDWKDKFEVARIDGIVEQDADRNGVYDHFYAQATIMAEGDSVLPHKLYLIRALNKSPEGGDTIIVSKYSQTDDDGDYLYRVYTNVISDVPVADDVQEFVAEGSGNVYTFRGQYKATNIVEPRDANGDPVQPYCYAMTGGVLKRPNPANVAGVPLGAFRWWLEVTPGSATSEISSKSVGFQFATHENVTSVGSIEVDLSEIEGLGVYYNLNGIRVDEPQKGLFIKNGKKVLLH